MSKQTRENIGKVIVFLLLALSISMLVSVAVTEYQDAKAVSTLPKNMQEQRLEELRHMRGRMTRVTIGLLGFFGFSYMMGRRKLMTKLWARNKELIKARDKAEESNRMKSAFIKSMSHEIRTPLNAVAGFSQVLCNPDFQLSDEQKADMQQRISDNVDQITTIVAELLELSETEHHRSVDELQDASCNEICHKAINRVKGKVKDGVKLSLSTGVADSFTVRTHADSVVRILTHLLDNAAKFTDKGSILLECRMEQISAVERQVIMSVTDTGTGIALEDRAEIFQKFFKGHSFREGVGLGLSICLRLARSIDATISLDNTYTGGSRFVLVLPYNG